MLFQIPRPKIPARAWKRPIGLGWEAPYAVKNPQNMDCGPWQGMPLGGLGAGCIGRSHRGDFNLWHLDSGEPVFRSLPACQFSIFERPEGGQAQAYSLCTEPPADGSLSSWNWYPQGQGTYHALYPRSWFEYEGVLQAELICEQFSPVWAGCYQESSYPVAVFDWTAHNPSDRPLTLSILLTWQNTVGWFTNAVKTPEGRDRYQSCWGDSTGNFNQWINDFHRVGCLFNRVRPHDEIREGEGQFAIASITNPALESFYLGRWNPAGDGREVWDYFAMDGSLPDREDETPAAPGEQIAAAMAIRFTVRPGRTRKIPFILAWDFPVMEFAPGVCYYRRHSDYFGRNGKNAWTVVRTALKHSDVWKEQIEAWQSPTLKRESWPDWLKMALFNELYLLTAGGTLWTAATENDPIGQFALWDSLDSRCYENLEARLYGSFALATLFPRLDKAVLEAFARAIPQEDGTLRDRGIRKAAGATPHDLGAPHEHPWEKSNYSRGEEKSQQPELASAFVLQVYRDYYLSGATDTSFLWECWAAIAATLARGNTWEPSGGLWIVALEAAIAIGKVLATSPPTNPQLEPENYPDSIEAAISTYQTWVEEARSHPPSPLTFDSDDLEIGDRLCAQFYAQLLNLPDIIERKDTESALRKAYEAYFTSDSPDPEIKIGSAYALAAFLVQTGMKEEALKLAETVVQRIYNQGLQFRTPASITSTNTFQCSYHLQAMAIWSLCEVLNR